MDKHTSREMVRAAIPPHIRELFGTPPVLNCENRDAYDRLLSELVIENDPSGIREWLWVRDLADLNWDILRIRRAIVSLLDISFKPALAQTLKTVLPTPERYRNSEPLADQWFADTDDEMVTGRSRVLDTLAKYGLAPESVVGQAFALHSDKLEKMERMLTSAERRRNAIARELQAHRQSSASRRECDQTIDAEPAPLAIESLTPFRVT
ncbi:MAG: hypothetical protein ACLPKB_24435 [Xanthobacteraceae bacterium]